MKKQRAKPKTAKPRTDKQIRAQKINETNFCLHGVLGNVKTHVNKLYMLGLPTAAKELSNSIEHIADAIDYIKQER